MSDLLKDRVIVAIGTQYDIGDEIGRGAMGVVYRGTDLRLHRTVAIKVLPPDLAFRPETRERFLREAEMAAQLSHPNIVPIFSVDEKSGIVHFVMAYVDGESVGERIEREPRPPLDLVRRVLRDVADALDYANRRGVIHRDIKPDNILLDRHGKRPDAPRELVEAVERAMAKHPEDRWQHAGQLRDALDLLPTASFTGASPAYVPQPVRVGNPQPVPREKKKK